MDDIAVLIPCYNEDKTIEKVVSDFKRVLPDAVIYVYDNNSTDDTEKLAKKAGAVLIVIGRPQERGRSVQEVCHFIESNFGKKEQE